MKRDLAHWRYIYRCGGWREVRRCLNCVYGPIAWKRIALSAWRKRQMRRTFKRMTPEQRTELIEALKGLGE